MVVTLNEIDGLRALLPQICELDVEDLFIVDGGSTDGTQAFVQDSGIHLHLQKSRGRGKAIREGLSIAKYDEVVVFSPDGNEDPKDILKLLDLLSAGADLAIASRFLPESRNEEDGKLLPLRAWANRFFTWIANSLWNQGSYVTDTINGFRAFRRSLFKELGIDAPGFAIEYQMSIRAMKLGLKIREISTREGNRIGGFSKAKSVPTGIAFLKFLVYETRVGTSWRRDL